MTTRLLWEDFTALRTRLAQSGPPFDRYSGDFRKVCVAWERLEQAGCFDSADSVLVAFQQQHTSVGADGLSYICFPDGTPDEVMVDCAVAHRPVLTARAEELMAAAGG